MFMLRLDGPYQCSYLLVYYYPCVLQFLTTQKEGQNGMSSDFSNVCVRSCLNVVGNLEMP